MTLQEFALEFVLYLQRRNRASRTISHYSQPLNSHIKPRFGSLDLRRIGPKQLIDLPTELAETPAAANHCVSLVMRMLRVARLMGYKTQTFDKPEALPEVAYSAALTLEEARRLWDVLEENPTSGALALKILLLTGLRKGEVRPLGHTDIRTTQRYLHSHMPDAVAAADEVSRKLLGD